MLKRLLAIFLCLGLVLQAGAVPPLHQAPCPMEEHMQAALEAGEALLGELPDCCQDLLTFATTGKACKAQFDCGFTAAMPGSVSIDARPPGTSVLPRAYKAWLPPVPIAGPWRPPALG